MRLEEIEEPLMREIRYIDKLVDGGQGRPMEKIPRRSPRRLHTPLRHARQQKAGEVDIGLTATAEAMTKRAFTFPGQGSQAVGMGKDLADAFPEARAVFDEVDAGARPRLAPIMFEGPARRCSSPPMRSRR